MDPGCGGEANAADACERPRSPGALWRPMVFSSTQERWLTAFGSNRTGVWMPNEVGDLACWARQPIGRPDLALRPRARQGAPVARPDKSVFKASDQLR